MLFAPTIGAALASGIGSCGDAARPAAPRKRSSCANVSRSPVLSVPLRRNGRRARHRGGFCYMNNGSKLPCNRPRYSDAARMPPISLHRAEMKEPGRGVPRSEDLERLALQPYAVARNGTKPRRKTGALRGHLLARFTRYDVTTHIKATTRYTLSRLSPITAPDRRLRFRVIEGGKS
jgi:hypothetical protein